MEGGKIKVLKYFYTLSDHVREAAQSPHRDHCAFALAATLVYGSSVETDGRLFQTHQTSQTPPLHTSAPHASQSTAAE